MLSILLTGGNRGIGYYMVKQFLEKGHRVTVLDITVENLEILQKSHRGRLLIYICDVRDSEQLLSSVADVASHWNNFDYVIHNARRGVYDEFDNTRKPNRSAFEKLHAIDFCEAIKIARDIIPYLRDSQELILFTTHGTKSASFIEITPYARNTTPAKLLARHLTIEHENSGIVAKHLPLESTLEAKGTCLARSLAENTLVIYYSTGTYYKKRLKYHFPH